MTDRHALWFWFSSLLLPHCVCINHASLLQEIALFIFFRLWKCIPNKLRRDYCKGAVGSSLLQALSQVVTWLKPPLWFLSAELFQLLSRKPFLMLPIFGVTVIGFPGSKRQELLSCSSWEQSLSIPVSLELIPSEASHVGSQPHMLFPVCLPQPGLFLVRIPAMLGESSSPNLILLHHLFLSLVSTYSHILRSWGLGPHQRNQHGGFTVHYSCHRKGFSSSECGNIWKK